MSPCQHRARSRQHGRLRVAALVVLGLAGSALIGLGRRVVHADAVAQAAAAPVVAAVGVASVRRALTGGVPSVSTVSTAGALSSSRSPCYIEGGVHDSNGRAVPGAQLRLITLRSVADGKNQDGMEVPQITQADEEGHFLITAWPGDFALYASAGDHSSALVEPLSLAPGESLTGMELSLSGNGVLSGIVVHADGTPARAGIGVRLGNSPVLLDPEPRQKSSFAVDGLPDAPLELLVTDSIGEVQHIRLARPQRDLVIRLAPPPGALIVEVRDEAGAPVAKALVMAYGEHTETLTYSSSDGQARLLGLARHVKLEARLDDRSSEVVELALDQQEQVVQLTLRPRARLSGQLLEAGGSPARGMVLLRTVGVEAPPMRGVLEDDGRFQLDHLQPGILELFHVDPLEDEPATDRPLRTIRISDASTHELGTIRLAPLRRVRGLVLDAAGEPAAHVDVETVATNERSFRAASAVTDERGRFELPARGPLHLRAVGVDGDLSPIVRLSGAADEETTLTLAGVGNLDGVLRGRYPEGARVRCTDGLWHDVEASGQFHLQCPPGAELELQAGGEMRHLAVEIEADEATCVEVRW